MPMAIGIQHMHMHKERNIDLCVIFSPANAGRQSLANFQGPIARMQLLVIFS